MLLLSEHEINITNRNITKWKTALGNIKPGIHKVTSHQMAEVGTINIQLNLICDNCGSKYNWSGSDLNSNILRKEFCTSCLSSKSQKDFFSTDRGKEIALQRAKTLRERPDYADIKARAAKSYSNWYKNSSDEIKLSRKELNSSNGITSSSKRWKDHISDTKYNDYKRLVYQATRKNKKIYSTWENYDKIGRCGIEGAYQLDHIIPIRYGFDNNICPSVIGHINNLQIITWEENRRKSDKHKVIN